MCFKVLSVSDHTGKYCKGKTFEWGLRQHSTIPKYRDSWYPCMLNLVNVFWTSASFHWYSVLRIKDQSARVRYIVTSISRVVHVSIAILAWTSCQIRRLRTYRRTVCRRFQSFRPTTGCRVSSMDSSVQLLCVFKQYLHSSRSPRSQNSP